MSEKNASPAPSQVLLPLSNRQKRILASLDEPNAPHPPTARNLARWVNVSHSTLHQDLRPLKTAGLVEVAGHTRTAAEVYRLTTAGAEILRSGR